MAGRAADQARLLCHQKKGVMPMAERKLEATLYDAELDVPYDDGAKTIFLYIRGTKGQVSEEVRQFLHYMENGISENAVNDTLRDFHHMVETVKKDREMSVKYMKQFERDNMMRAEGREEERKNTEREHARAERECARADKERTRANALEAELKRLKSKML